MKKKIRELMAGEKVSIRSLVNPDDPQEVAHEWGMVIMIEPIAEAYRVHAGDAVWMLEGDDEVEVADAD